MTRIRPGATQDGAALRLSTPLGPDALIALALEGEERLSAPFDYTVEAEATEDGLDLASLPGQSADVTLVDGDGGETALNAVIWSVRSRGRSVTLRLRPWWSRLGLSSDHRVFQDMGVLAILDAIVGEASLGPVKKTVSAEPPARPYCVQFGETHLDFLSRLLEAEGIGYFFEHVSGEHSLVLFDDVGNCPALPGGDLQALDLPTSSSFVQDRRVQGLTARSALAPGKVDVRDYVFETPDQTLEASIGDAPRGLYLWPGGHATADAGQSVARRRLEAHEAGATGVEGETPWRPLRAGHAITLTGAPEGLNVKHLVRALRRRAGDNLYIATFDALPADIPYRPALLTPRPAAPGPQTAIVTGPDGEEIWTDRHGRVKVQFHWDRKGEKDENASCWLRVAQSLAGAGWGAFHLPRIGQEVVVSFLDGDPDRPLVTGVVYNGANPPPYDLPAEQTKSTLKSDSSKDAEGFNELRFEDKAGEEEVFLHAQKDLVIEVENARTTTVKEGDDSLTVGGKRTVKITGDETRTYEAKLTETVTGDYVLTVKGGLTIKVSGNVAIQADGGLNLKSGGAFSIAAGGAFSLSAGSSASISAGSSVEIKGAAMVQVQGGVVKVN